MEQNLELSAGPHCYFPKTDTCVALWDCLGNHGNHMLDCILDHRRLQNERAMSMPDLHLQRKY